VDRRDRGGQNDRSYMCKRERGERERGEGEREKEKGRGGEGKRERREEGVVKVE